MTGAVFLDGLSVIVLRGAHRVFDGEAVFIDRVQKKTYLADRIRRQASPSE